MRRPRQPQTIPGESLFRTMAMSLIIAGIISFLAMFWPLYRAAPAGAGMEYYLPWCLPYGIVDLGIATTGVVFTTNWKEKPGLYKLGFIVGIALGVILLGGGLPIGILLGNVEFCISTMVIAACVVAISILGLTSVVQKS